MGNTENVQAPVQKRERWGFTVSINGFVVNQKSFTVNGFKREAYSSIELVEALDKCVDIIQSNLKKKTAIYFENTQTQCFETEDEMNAVINSKTRKFDVPSYFIVRENGSVFVWDGAKAEPYTKPFYKGDYIPEEDPTADSSVIEFAFTDNGRKVATKMIDGRNYPRFVRSNIDITNSRNRYKENNIYAPIDYFVIEKCNAELEDLTDSIVEVLEEVLTKEDKADYSVFDTYGKTTYNYDIYRVNKKYENAWERATHKKTADYFNSL